MISPAYESFVNDIVNKISKISSKDDYRNIDFANNVLSSSFEDYYKASKEMVRKYKNIDDFKVDIARRCYAFTKKFSSINITSDEFDFASFSAIMYYEILELGDLRRRKNVKTSSGFESSSTMIVSPTDFLFGIIIDVDKIDKRCPNSGLPRTIIIDPITNMVYPIFDGTIGILTIYDPKSKNYSNSIMVNRDREIDDAHNGRLQSPAYYLNEYIKKIK